MNESRLLKSSVQKYRRLSRLGSCSFESTIPCQDISPLFGRGMCRDHWRRGISRHTYIQGRVFVVKLLHFLGDQSSSFVF